ncbi:uncharacterized protein LOC134980153 [Pseudophryne corroboree]|uniref:uncharacterized protein LOC134980153 n=1 Tax=Pseudophryne corroboree TaxID=495146 RepID=UPI0030819247
MHSSTIDWRIATRRVRSCPSHRNQNYCFPDVFIGWPGHAHDSRVLGNSELFQIAEENQHGWLFPREKSKFVDGVEIPVHLIGDAAYRLRRWLIKGFTQHLPLSPEQVHFTHTLSSARMVVENAFGRLKGCWRCLLQRNDVAITLVPDVVAACCILHNFCKLQKEHFLPEWNVVDTELCDTPVEEAEAAYEGEISSGSAEEICNTLTANLTTMTQ